MALDLIFSEKEPGKIGAVTLDATINEQHEYANKVTKFPVEDGSDISDHAKREPERITIEGIITNSPVQFLGGIFSGDRVKEGLEELLKIAGYDYPAQANSPTAAPNSLTLVDVVTGLRIYSDMALTRLSIPRGPRTGNALRFSAEFVKIRFVQSQFTLIQNTSELNGRAERIEDQSATTTDVGVQSAQEVDTSRAKTLYDNAVNFIQGGN